MYRMSQKLLILLLMYTFIYGIANASSWRLICSITKGADDIPLHYPLGLLYDSNRKRIYVVDSGNNRLLSFNTDCSPLKVFDAGGKLRSPMYMTKFNKIIVVVERNSNTLKRIDLVSRRIEVFKITKMGKPLLIDKMEYYNGNLFILDRLSGSIVVYDDNFRYLRSLSVRGKHFNGFFDIKLKNGHLWGMEMLTGRVFELTLDGRVLKEIIPKKVFVEPVSFDVDRSGNLYILDRYLKKIFVFSNNGGFRFSLSGEGFREGKLYYPWLVLMAEDKLLILDEGNGRVDVWGR